MRSNNIILLRNHARLRRLRLPRLHHASGTDGQGSVLPKDPDSVDLPGTSSFNMSVKFCVVYEALVDLPAAVLPLEHNHTSPQT